MDKDRWAKTALEMQKHLDALEQICKRENIGMVSISVSGIPEGCIDRRKLVSSITYIDESEEKHYSLYKWSNDKTEILADCEVYKTYTCA